MPSAAVVGSGPNGLAAAVRLARAGVRVTVYERGATIGGGARSVRTGQDGPIADVCAAVHPLGVASPYLRSLPLERSGLRWRWSEIELGHPLDDGSAALLHRDLDRTARELGPDGPAWRDLFQPLSAGFDRLAAGVLGPLLRFPRHPLTLARFGPRALRSVTGLAERWHEEPARALFAGCAAHAFRPLDQPMSASVGLVLAAAGHARGWPVAEGGSQSIVQALADDLREHGGSIVTDTMITSLGQVEPSDLVLLDVTPGAAADLLEGRLTDRRADTYRSFRHGPGAHKVDYVIRGDVPWTNPELARCGTVHLGGSLEQIATSEAEVLAGRVPDDPFVLVAQQYRADPTRSAGELNPIWAYAHVPGGTTEDLTGLVTGQLERFAPGFAARIVSTQSRTAHQFADYNPNYVGGDIGGGATTGRQLVIRPRLALNPYATGVDGVYLCSASTPPGAGVHGMCGYFAAGSALAHLGSPDRAHG